MSVQPRASGGNRNTVTSSKKNGTSSSTVDTTNKKVDKISEKKKPTPEQIRIAQITDIKCGTEDPKIREKVAKLMETTQRSEEEVCCALYECDFDLDVAVAFLLDTLPVGSFISSKKKKHRSPGNNDATADEEWTENSNSNDGNNNNMNDNNNNNNHTNNNNNNNNNNSNNNNINNNNNNSSSINNNNNNNNIREQSRSRGNMRGGRGGLDSRGWKGRESRENDSGLPNTRNSSERWHNNGRYHRGSFRGGYGSRGGRGGGRGIGPRLMGHRDKINNNYFRPQEINEVDTWESTIVNNTVEQNKSDDTWGDWDNEEYTGSLSDTKVFTPSTINNTQLNTNPDLTHASSNVVTTVEKQTVKLNDDLTSYKVTGNLSNTSSVLPNVCTVGGSGNNASIQYTEIQPATGMLHTDLTHINSSATLSVEQSQYFNSLAAQNINNSHPMNTYQPKTVQYSTGYGPATNYNIDNSITTQQQHQQQQQQQQQPTVRKQQRAKLPPPSKIPSSAVEMPADTLNNIGYIDVQFGGLDFGSEESFDSVPEKLVSKNDNEINITEVPSEYPTKHQQTSLLQSQVISTGDGGLSTQNEQLNANYNQRPVNINQTIVHSTSSSNTVAAISNVTTGLDNLSKTEHFNSGPVNNATYQNQTAYNTKPFQTNSSQLGYNNANYTNTPVSASHTYASASAAAVAGGGGGGGGYSNFNQPPVNSFTPQTIIGGIVNSNTITTSGLTTINNTAPSIHGGSNINSTYMSNQYPTTQGSAVYPPSSYQNSMYSGINSNNTGYASNINTTNAQYSSYNSTKNKELPPTTIFDSSVYNVIPNTTPNVTNTVSTAVSLSTTSLTNTKVTNSTTAKSNTGNIVPNIQYIQTGVPFYQQPVYSYEDIQMMQQRMPHVPGYYDINYQTPTSLGAGAVRDANLGSVAYSGMNDGRYARTDNSSPVTSTLSQQTASAQPMLNVPYAYFYGGNMMASGFQYGTPTIYPPQLATANASAGAQFSKTSYNNNYGSNYDSINQTTPEYNKGTYQGSGQQQKGQNSQGSGNGTDVGSSMYGKPHVTLNKVNSYEKQSYHSATPPPFNLAGTQTAGANSAQGYSTQHLYIQAMPTTHMNIHQPIQQDATNSGQRQQSANSNKTGVKQGYSQSYWTNQN